MNRLRVLMIIIMLIGLAIAAVGIALGSSLQAERAITAELKHKVETQRSEIYSLTKELSDTVEELEKIEGVYHEVTQRREWNAVSGQVTAYSPYDNVSGIENNGNPDATSTGVKPTRGTIAVDPKRIPYGSSIVIMYDNGDIETGRAEDTGGAIRSSRGMLIDVYRDTYAETVRHGRRRATILWKTREEN